MSLGCSECGSINIEARTQKVHGPGGDYHFVEVIAGHYCVDCGHPHDPLAAPAPLPPKRFDWNDKSTPNEKRERPQLAATLREDRRE